MKLIVKTITGGKFEVEVGDSNTVEQVKSIIEINRPDLPAAGMKLIYAGKVLKDADSIASCGIKPNDFLVVMIAKAAKPKKTAAPATATATAAATPATTAEDAKTPAAAKPSDAPAPDPLFPVAPAQPDLSAEAISNLMAMGFPEAEVRHCLAAANGNPDVAVEFLTNGIPEGVTAAAATTTTSRSAGSSSTTGATLQSLRNHPQFDDLRRLVQSNPQMLQQVLTQIGQQQPELLQEINANQARFIEMMNEPVNTQSSTINSANPSSSSSVGTASSTAAVAGWGGPAAAGLGNPAQMAQMIQNMSADEVNQMADMMGISPDHLRQTAQVIGQMPPEQINQFMMQAMGSAGGADSLGLAGGMGGAQVLELTEEEMQAVERLTEMGFDRSEAAQAFIACDKNEALAANLLMDSMGDGGGFGYGGGGGGDNGGNGNANDDDEDMYD